MSKYTGEFVIIEDYCKSCGLCISVCPVDILKISTGKTNFKGYDPVEVIDKDKCIGCESCSLICPETAINVKRIER